MLLYGNIESLGNYDVLAAASTTHNQSIQLTNALSNYRYIIAVCVGALNTSGIIPVALFKTSGFTKIYVSNFTFGSITSNEGIGYEYVDDTHVKQYVYNTANLKAALIGVK